MLVLEADLMFPLLLVFANHIFTTKNVERNQHIVLVKSTAFLQNR